jgi:hypothetical protein
MQDAGNVLSAYVASRFGTTLEQLLADATGGAAPAGTESALRITCDAIGSFVYEDGGASELYQGLLTLEGVTYRFRCSVFIDAGGDRFTESIGELESVRWGVRLAVPDQAAG